MTALGKRPSDLEKGSQIAMNRWSQYAKLDGKRPITHDAMFYLKDEFGVTFDWMYAGDRRHLDDELKTKIRQAERELSKSPPTRTRGRPAKHASKPAARAKTA